MRSPRRFIRGSIEGANSCYKDCIEGALPRHKIGLRGAVNSSDVIQGCGVRAKIRQWSNFLHINATVPSACCFGFLHV